jgi:hypothetical protein
MDVKIYKAGYLAGVLAFLATVAFVIVQILQVLAVIPYPWDEILIYGTSLCIVIPFLMEMLALHYHSPVEKKYWSHAALIFSILYAVFVTANYVVQLATVIPMSLKGRSKDIRVLIQTPHSLFWDFDAIGYICMGLAMSLALPVFEKTGCENRVRLTFLMNALVTPLIAIVYFYPTFSTSLLLLGSLWGITAPLAMLSLSLLLRRNYRKLSSIE